MTFPSPVLIPQVLQPDTLDVPASNNPSPPPTQAATRPKPYQLQNHRHSTPGRPTGVNTRFTPVNLLCSRYFAAGAAALYTPRHARLTRVYPSSIHVLACMPFYTYYLEPFHGAGVYTPIGTQTTYCTDSNALFSTKEAPQ